MPVCNPRVDSVEALALLEQIPKAMKLVREILERVLLKGEYITREGQEYLIPVQYREISHAIAVLSHLFHYKDSAQHHT